MKEVAKVVFEDSTLAVLDKAAGVVVNRSNTTKYETLQDWVEKRYGDEINVYKDDESDFFSRSGIVHRLDKETSGVILFAKNPKSFVHLQSQFKARTVQKKYTALCHGKVVPNNGVVNAPIGRLPWNRMRFGVTASGRSAESQYEVLHYYRWRKERKSDETLTLVEVQPKTGRTHQIRVHMKYIGYPLFADALYCGRKTYRKDKKILNRHFLHASKIAFDYPTNGNRVEFASQLPEELSKVICLLQ